MVSGTGCRASKADKAELEPELESELEPEQELGPWWEQELELGSELGLGLELVQGPSKKLAASPASRVCLVGRSSMVQAGWPALAKRGNRTQMVAGWARRQ